MRGETNGGVGDDADVETAAAEGVEEVGMGAVVCVDGGPIVNDNPPIDELVASKAGIRGGITESTASRPSDVSNQGHATGDGKVIGDVPSVEGGENVGMQAARGEGEGGGRVWKEWRYRLVCARMVDLGCRLWGVAVAGPGDVDDEVVGEDRGSLEGVATVADGHWDIIFVGASDDGSDGLGCGWVDDGDWVSRGLGTEASGGGEVAGVRGANDFSRVSARRET